MSRPSVLITCLHVFDQLDLVEEVLEPAGVAWELAEVRGQQLDADELLATLPPHDAIIAGDDHVTREVIEACDRLRIVQKWGIGIDAIDVAAAEERGIPVRNTPGVFGDEIADYALGYLLLLLRQQHRIDAAVKRGEWLKVRGRSPRGMTLGVLGYGSSGRQMAVRGAALGMHVLAHDPYVDVGDGAAEIVALDELASRSDVLSLHAPLTDDNHGLVDAALLATMPRGSWLVNVARGPIVVTDDVVAALDSGQLAGAALDVHEVEPLPADHPLTERDDVVLGSHNASNTVEAVRRTTRRALENVAAVLST